MCVRFLIRMGLFHKYEIWNWSMVGLSSKNKPHSKNCFDRWMTFSTRIVTHVDPNSLGPGKFLPGIKMICLHCLCGCCLPGSCCKHAMPFLVLPGLWPPDCCEQIQFWEFIWLLALGGLCQRDTGRWNGAGLQTNHLQFASTLYLCAIDCCEMSVACRGYPCPLPVHPITWTARTDHKPLGPSRHEWTNRHKW